jgi:GT2 family glycosyltransferase
LTPYKKIFAIVVTYNGERWIRKCLKSLTESEYPISVIVVDNASKDTTVSLIKGEFPQVILLEENSNLGFGQANNKGISLALSQEADYFLLLNQDAWIETDTIASLMQVPFESKGFGVISPLHLTGSGKGLDAGFANCISKNPEIDPLNFTEKNANNYVHKAPFINAAAWLVSKETIEEVGGFDPLFHHYGEDFEYSNRLKFHDLKMGFVSNCCIYHDRELRDISSTFKVRQKFVWYYSIGVRARLVDVNKSFVRCIIEVVFWTIKEAVFRMLQGSMFAPLAWLQVWLSELKNLSSIIKDRKLIKSKKKFLFLN